MTVRDLRNHVTPWNILRVCIVRLKLKINAIVKTKKIPHFLHSIYVILSLSLLLTGKRSSLAILVIHSIKS